MSKNEPRSIEQTVRAMKKCIGDHGEYLCRGRFGRATF